MTIERDLIGFLKDSIDYRFYHYTKWFQLLFGIPETSIEIDKIGLKYDKQEETISYRTDNDTHIVRITSYPILRPTMPITIDSNWLENVTDTTDTTVGRLIVNALLLRDNFGRKIPYQNKPFSIGHIETIIAEKLIDDTDSPPEDKITVSQYVDFIDSVTYLESQAILINISATRKNVVPPPGIDTYRNKVLKELSPIDSYEKVAEFERRLKEYDKKWLEDDPSYGKYLRGKLVNVSRKKTHLTIGVERTFETTDTPTLIETSLSDGWPKDPEKIVELYNGSRAGSFSRGAETVKGGLSAKIILRALNHYLVSDTDCGTKLTLSVTITDDTFDKYVGRYVMVDNAPKLIVTSDKSTYLGKTWKLRTPLYCNAEKGYFCPICLGKRNSEVKEGIVLAATEISSIILNTSMKAMHGTALSTTEIDLGDIIW